MHDRMISTMPRCKGLFASVLVAIAFEGWTLNGHAQSDLSAAVLSRTHVSAQTYWSKYVRSPASTTLKPVSVVSTTGSVTNPEAMVLGGKGQTTLNNKFGEPAPVLLLDYGQDVGGLPQYNIAHADRSNILQASFSEMLVNMTPTGDGAATTIGGNSGNPFTFERYAVQQGASVKQSAQIQGGFRYQRITLTQPGTVTLNGVDLTFTPPLYTPSQYQGYFLSNDEQLNQIWFDGAYTINLTQIVANTPSNILGQPANELPLLVDGAKRDRTVWGGDLLISAETNHIVFGQYGDAYTRGSLSVINAHPGTIPVLLTPSFGFVNTPGPMPGLCHGPINRDCLFYSASYSISYVLAVYTYWQQTGDIDFLKSSWPLIRRELAWEQQQIDLSTGLLTTYLTDGFDWNVDHHEGHTTANSVLHYASLLRGTEMALAMGDSMSASQYRSAATSIKNALASKLWNKQLGLFDSSLEQRGGAVLDANAWAAYFNAVSPEQRASMVQILDAYLDTPLGLRVAQEGTPGYTQRISPFASGFALYADFEAQRADLALKQLRQTWGWMSSHDPQGTAWERIDFPSGGLSAGGPGIGGSAAHGWGTAATVALSRYVLGISPKSPGYVEWAVRPQPSGLQWAQGRVPTSRGYLSSRWEIGQHNFSFRLTVEAPTGSSGSVAIPLLGAARAIYQNGLLVWDGFKSVNGSNAQAQGEYVTFPKIVGLNTWAWTSM